MTLEHKNFQIYCSDGFSDVPYERYKIYRLTEDVVDLFFHDIYTENKCTYRLKRFLTKYRLMGLSFDIITKMYIQREYFTDYIPELYMLYDLIIALKTCGDLYVMKTPKQSVLYRVGEVLYFNDDLLVKRKFSSFNNAIMKEYVYKNDKLQTAISSIKMGSIDWIELYKRYYSYNVIDKCNNEVYNVMYVDVRSINDETCAYYFKDNKLLQVKSFDYKREIDQFGNDCIDYYMKWDAFKGEGNYINYSIYNTYNSRNELIKKEYKDPHNGINKTTHYKYRDSDLYEVEQYFDDKLMLHCVYFHLYNQGVLEKIMVEDRTSQRNFHALMDLKITTHQY